MSAPVIAPNAIGIWIFFFEVVGDLICVDVLHPKIRSFPVRMRAVSAAADLAVVIRAATTRGNVHTLAEMLTEIDQYVYELIVHGVKTTAALTGEFGAFERSIHGRDGCI